MARSTYRWIFPLLFFLLPLAACEREKTPALAPEETARMETAPPARAVADLKPTKGSRVSGTVTFASSNGAVQVVAELEGLEPGRHGFHIHETGDCSAPDGTSAGGHFNPDGTPHGAPENPPALRHAGDLGNVEADAEGKARYERVDPVISLAGENSIMGKAVIVHAQPDDLGTQPTGNAGARLACGVIQAED